MNTGDSELPPNATVKLALAQSAFQSYFATCFWFMNPSLVVTEEILPQIIKGLRSHGDREAFKVAQQLCR